MYKIKKSLKLFEEAKLHMPGGVNSPVRAFKNIDGNPIFFSKAKGPYVFDADDNKYIDYIGSWGPMILGHSNPNIIRAISKQLQLGTSYGAPTNLESKTAEIIKDCVPSIEKIRMVNSGTEATMSAIVEGKIQTRKWQDKDGNDRYTTEVLGNQLTMLGSRGSSDNSNQMENSSDTPFPEDDSGEGLTDDDIPF